MPRRKMDEERGTRVRRIAEVPHDGLPVVDLHEPAEAESGPRGPLRGRPRGGKGVVAEKRARVERDAERGQVAGSGDQAGCGVERRRRILGQGRAAAAIDAIGARGLPQHCVVRRQRLAREIRRLNASSRPARGRIASWPDDPAAAARWLP